MNGAPRNAVSRGELDAQQPGAAPGELAVPLRVASWRMRMSQHDLRDNALINALVVLAAATGADAPARCAALDEVVRAAQALRRSAAGAGGPLRAHLDEVLAAVRDEQAAIGCSLLPYRHREAAANAPQRPPLGAPMPNI